MTVRPQKLAINTFAPVALAASVLVALWGWRDYRRWRALGPGGLPPTWRGWLRTTGLRLRKKDPFDTRPLHDRKGLAEDIASLASLPRRLGPRPQVAPYPVPHRQLTQHASGAVRASLRAAFDAQVERDPARLCYALSHFEKNNQAVTLHARCCHHADARLTCGEVAHIHPSDGSMHMVLSVSDAAAVVECGWGERHGLAGVTFGLPLTYTLIYAPRDESEVAVNAMILDAAVTYMARQPDT